MATYTEPAWGTAEHIPDLNEQGASIFAASKAEMLALVRELLISWFKMETGLRHPLLSNMQVRLPGDDAAGLRVVTGIADEVNSPSPTIYVYMAGENPVQTFVNGVSVSTPDFTVDSGNRHGTEFIMLHIYAERGLELQALADECSRFWSMMQEKLRLFCTGLIDLIPQKGAPMSVDKQGRLNVQVPAQWLVTWSIRDLPEDGY